MPSRENKEMIAFIILFIVFVIVISIGVQREVEVNWPPHSLLN